ncbi:hypothetical protein [Xylocopilactobacillus apis]|uniref:Uncharacterized protein n=1 Tax=Xylocopilactobacillus apis TaxID=2932183 RepID=A0AAU9DM60_9LACO|nr:hypothetical protein [Xylocopilactobacillus apis]BDR56704.1 hypothetical protein KIMC2_12660 [Xylocopilactobacillus apis]
MISFNSYQLQFYGKLTLIIRGGTVMPDEFSVEYAKNHKKDLISFVVVGKEK